MYMCMYEYMYLCMLHIYIYVCMYVYMYVCMYVCMYRVVKAVHIYQVTPYETCDDLSSDCIKCN